ncbi:hypothetical protein ACWDBO_49180 [Streptomyces mirabilis]|uniref:hypothetical protein n=1 Tax=Streptomyces TaxID=1883 RepID=UPI0029A6BA3E|nr:hypothetical protein [Streptomyces sp. AK02-04a]MDX3754871.1 hypothetical protein [Streptomyces sp. AK02-04a]
MGAQQRPGLRADPSTVRVTPSYSLASRWKSAAAAWDLVPRTPSMVPGLKPARSSRHCASMPADDIPVLEGRTVVPE